MKKIFKRLSQNPAFSILIAKTISDILCVICCYNLFPYLLNYPPYSINTPFQLSVNPTYYYVYYFALFSIGIAIDLFFTYRMLKPLKKLKKEKIKIEETLKIRKLCYEFPNKSFLMTTCLIPLFVIIVALLLTNTNFILTIKIGMLAVIFLGIPNLFIYIFANRILKEVLVKTFNENIFKNEKIKHIKIWKSLLIQILSTVAISMIVIFMFVISNTTTEMGNYRYETYKEKLKTLTTEIKRSNMNKEQIISYLNNNLQEDWFIREDGVYSGKTEISKFMKNYMDFYAKDNGGRIYDDYGVDRQGIVSYLEINNQEIIIGLIYTTVPSSLFTTLLILVFGFVIVDALIIYLSGKAIGRELDEINKRLSYIAQNNTIELNLLPITSNDEIGELTKEFNDVQNNTHNLYEEIKENQEVITIQAKFATIGEMATLMAHDINNPASSLDASIELLNHFEVEESKKESYKKLVDNMRISNNKILKVVNDTQDQFRNASDTKKETFSLKDLLSKLADNEESEIKKVDGKINILMHKDIKIYGTESKLYQVIINLIRNSVLSYRENNIHGDVDIYTSEDKEFYTISVEDTAGGIPEEVRPTLFKKILTTRGAKGTGLGLYLSSGIIKGEFKGDLTFETNNKGTIFYIKLPKNKEE